MTAIVSLAVQNFSPIPPPPLLNWRKQMGDKQWLPRFEWIGQISKQGHGMHSGAAVLLVLPQSKEPKSWVQLREDILISIV